jgi:uncharacterized protein YndB with AHSA1/START domain
MKNYTLDIVLPAPTSAVYEALVTQNGLRGWWTESWTHFVGSLRKYMSRLAGELPISNP